MKILVTGGAGFIGSHIVDRLIKENHHVAVIDDLSTGKKDYIHPKAVFYKTDVSSPELSAIFEKENPDAVFHYAAQVDVKASLENPANDAKINILGSINVLEQCKRFGVKKIIFASSAAVYGETSVFPTTEEYPLFPFSPYGITKSGVEHYLRYYYNTFGISFVALRLANVYGPRQNAEGEAGVIATFCNQMLHGTDPVINGDGKQTRDFIFVDDVVEANILALESDYTGMLNIATAQETSVQEIFQKLRGIINPSIKESYGPERQGDQERSSLSWDLAKKELGWNPQHTPQKGLEKTVAWMRTVGEEYK